MPLPDKAVIKADEAQRKTFDFKPQELAIGVLPVVQSLFRKTPLSRRISNSPSWWPRKPALPNFKAMLNKRSSILECWKTQRH